MRGVRPRLITMHLQWLFRHIAHPARLHDCKPPAGKARCRMEDPDRSTVAGSAVMKAPGLGPPLHIPFSSGRAQHRSGTIRYVRMVGRPSVEGWLGKLRGEVNRPWRPGNGRPEEATPPTRLTLPKISSFIRDLRHKNLSQPPAFRRNCVASGLRDHLRP